MAYACNDMNVQLNVNTDYGSWYRCKRVEFDGDTVRWEISQTGRYYFANSYERLPHHQLINATDDDSLKAFVRAWGPLRSGLNTWSGSDPLDSYRKERDKIALTALIFASLEKRELQRNALLRFLDSSVSTDWVFPSLLEGLRNRFAVLGNSKPIADESGEEWVNSLTQQQIKEATKDIAHLIAINPINIKFVVEPNRSGYSLRAGLNISNLMDAMLWMLWMDVSRNHPAQFCAECLKLIQFKTHHAKKYCSYECAHRRAAREWLARKRKNGRKNNGTQKAR